MLNKGYSLDMGDTSVHKEYDGQDHPYWYFRCGMSFTKHHESLQEAFEEARERFALPKEEDRVRIIDALMDLIPSVRRFVMTPAVGKGMSFRTYRRIGDNLFHTVVVNVSDVDRNGFRISAHCMSFLNDHPVERKMTVSDEKTHEDLVDDFRDAWIRYFNGVLEVNDMNLHRLREQAEHMEEANNEQ